MTRSSSTNTAFSADSEIEAARNGTQVARIEVAGLGTQEDQNGSFLKNSMIKGNS